MMWFFAISVATLLSSCSTSVEYTPVFSGSADNSSRNLYIASFVGAKHVYEPYVDKVLKRLLFALLLMFAFLRMVTKLLNFSGLFSKWVEINSPVHVKRFSSAISSVQPVENNPVAQNVAHNSAFLKNLNFPF